MKKSFLFALFLLHPIYSGADSFRCGRTIVKLDESSNALIRKCGKPVRKFTSKAIASQNGVQKQLGVSNWVYERRGKKDMIVSVYQGVVVKIEVD